MTPELHTSWGKRVQKRRKELAFSQEDLAKICGLRQSTISRIEAGQSVPTDRVKWLIAGALQETVENLFPYPAVKPPFPSEVAS